MTTKKKPTDYQGTDEAARLVEEPISEHLLPEDDQPELQERTLHGVFRYMGSKEGIDFYGVWFERKEWTEVYDPFIAKKARHNVDFETQGKDRENGQKGEKRAAGEENRQRYMKAQEAKQRRANKAADQVLGNE